MRTLPTARVANGTATTHAPAASAAMAVMVDPAATLMPSIMRVGTPGS